MKSTIHDVLNHATASKNGETIRYCSAAAFSIYASEHIAEHQYKDVPSYATLMAATGRLEWLLIYGRAELSGLFKEEDITILLDCYQGDVFSPFELKNLAAPLFEHLNIDPKSALDSEYGELLCTLFRLTPMQALSLADVLEQMWHRGMPTGQTVAEFLTSLGINLR